MGNYKGLKFKNTKDDFKRWCRESYKAMSDGKYKRYYKKGDYYLELQYVEFAGHTFVSKTIRKYDKASEDFVYVYDEEEQALLQAWCRKIKVYEGTFITA